MSGDRRHSRALSVLRTNPVYRRLWLAQAGSWLGDALNNVALAAATLALTRSAADMALVLLCRGLPGLVLSPLLGPAIERWPKRRVLLVADLGRGGLALGFIAAFAGRDMAWVYALSALLGAGASLFGPAQRAALRQVVAVEDLMAANTALMAAAGLVAAAGAALGGLAATWLGPDLAFAMNAASYVWSAAWILATRWPERAADGAAADGATYLGRLGAGVRVVTGNRIALAAVLAGVGFALTSGPYFVAPSVLADLVYGKGALGIGLVYAADGLGFVLAAIVLGRLVGQEPGRLRRLYGLGFVVQAVFLTAFCLSTRLWQGMAAIAVSQVASGLILTLTPTFLQTHTPVAAQARVFALQASVGGVAAQASIGVAGWLMARHGVAAVALPAGMVCLAAAAVWLVLTAGADMRAPAASGEASPGP